MRCFCSILHLIMRKIFPDYFIITLKGLAMGAADVVPGVSGGTIAFISGIYEELIQSIDNVKLRALITLKNEGFWAAWKQVNGGFLLALMLGIFTSIVSLSKLIIFLLDNHPIIVWSFFFGLVVASITHIWKQVERWTGLAIVMFLLGTIISYYITIARPVTSPDSYFYLFISGFIAIIAMILPGISGAFILVLMGSYETVIGNINTLRDSIFSWNTATMITSGTSLGIFAVGCILGLKMFSKTLRWMFANYKDATLTLLIGFMLGSLNKVWPWKEVLETRINSHGEIVPVVEKSILPQNFNGDNLLLIAIVFSILGYLTIFLLEKVATKYQK